jgi:hypothetical protein
VFFDDPFALPALGLGLLEDHRGHAERRNEPPNGCRDIATTDVIG